MGLTINNIAKLANVSRTTVSRVLNNKSDVNAETRERVLEIISKYDYHPSVLAKGAITKKSYSIGLIIPYGYNSIYINPFNSEVIRGITTEAEVHGYYLLMCSCTENKDYVSIFDEKRVEGFIILSPNALNEELFVKFDKANIPYAATAKIPGNKSLDYVDVDNVYGASLAVEHLISLGHRKIATITGPKLLLSHYDRLDGYKLALLRNNIACREDYIKFGDNTIGSGYEAAKELMELNNPPTAIFAAGDIMAIGTIKALHEKNINVPRDVSVVGFDDIFLAEHTDPPLTTMRQPIGRKGSLACEMLINIIENKEYKEEQILPVELVIRSSTGKVL